VDVSGALGTRRSCRSYRDTPVAAEDLSRVLDAALRGPSAGNTWALDLVVLDEPDAVGRYWDLTLPSGPAREKFAWPSLLRAPVLIVVATEPGAYLRRYAEPDKARAGLGDDESAWSVPFWWVDAGASIMAMLLAATDAGLGSLLFGLFDHEAAMRDHLGVPDDRRLVATIALGHPATESNRRSGSLKRQRPKLPEIVHRSRW